jgi:hypothetical protein
MMNLLPAILDKQPQRFFHPRCRSPSSSLWENHRQPNESVVNPHQGGHVSDQLSRSAGTGTILHQDSVSGSNKCWPSGRYPTRACRMVYSLTLIR